MAYANLFTPVQKRVSIKGRILLSLERFASKVGLWLESGNVAPRIFLGNI